MLIWKNMLSLLNRKTNEFPYSMTEKCSPHNWETPEPGDQYLRCLECPKTIAIWDTTPNMRGSIVNSVEKCRPNDSDSFKAFFGYGRLKEAFEAKTAIGRADNAPPITIVQ